ncbi:hypothetical protein N9L68_08545 [bacterium]|nr:hypothetical protein [bacterium]
MSRKAKALRDASQSLAYPFNQDIVVASIERAARKADIWRRWDATKSTGWKRREEINMKYDL